MANTVDDTAHASVPVSEILLSLIKSRAELAGCATALRDAAREIDQYAETLDAELDVTGLRFAALGLNASAVRATFSILTARGIGDRLALGASLVEVRS